MARAVLDRLVFRAAGERRRGEEGAIARTEPPRHPSRSAAGRSSGASASTQQRDAMSTEGVSGRSTSRCAAVKDLDIRRPELKGTRRQGTVRWFTDDKGYGRITADD